MARALSTHSQIMIASDPYFQFFKSYRNEIYSEKIPKFDHNAPVSDNFWSEYLALDKLILNSYFDTKIKNTSHKEIITLTKNYVGRDSEKLLPILSSLNSSNYKDLFSELVSLIYKAYGKDSTRFVGFKCTFSELFIAPTIKAFPNSKIICIVRDPRAIYASQTVPRKNYPLLYVVRQWRKSIEYMLQNIDKENLQIFKYEDLIDNPEIFMKEISNFIGVDYEVDMINPNKYVDGAGVPWSQNSSYNKSKRGTINNKNKDKWKGILTKKDIQLIEDLCDAEMKIFGYSRETTNKMVNQKNIYIENKNDCRTWFREYFFQYELNETEINKEIIRYLYLNNKIFDNHISDKLLVSATSKFLDTRLF